LGAHTFRKPITDLAAGADFGGGVPPREDGELDDELDPEVLEPDPESEPLLLDEELDELLHGKQQ